jgi:hypothetical protein
MNRFDSLFNTVFEATNVQQTNTTQPSQQTNTTQPSQQTNTTQPSQQTNTNNQAAQQNNNVQKPAINVQKLMTDFNNNNVSIKSPKDLEQYGIKVS